MIRLQVNAENVRRREGARARREYVRALRLRGMSYRRIGERLQISKQRAHQIFKRAQEEANAEG